METKKSMNWNTLLITVNLAVVGFGGSKLFDELRSLHDTVIGINFQIVDLRTRVTALEIESQQAKVSWQQWKERHP